MTEYTARCSSGLRDEITARVDGGRVELKAESGGEYKMETYLHASDARTFARGILALADELDGDEAKEKPATTAKWGTIKPGDKVRVLVDDAEAADVSAGDVLVVTNVSASMVTTDATNGDFWYFANTTSIELVDEAPAAQATTAPTPSPRARYVDEARALFGDTYFEADSLTRLAEFLAGAE